MAEVIYKDYNNSIRLRLYEDNTIVNLNERGITKMGILFKEIFYYSDNFSGIFDWTTNGSTGIVSIQLGAIDGVGTGRDKYTELIVHDVIYTGGIVWGTFDLEIKELTGTTAT